MITVLNRGLDFAVPISEVREVISAGRIFPVPGAVRPFEGLMIYREDRVLPIFSLEGLLGLEGGVEGGLVLVGQSGDELFGVPIERIGELVQEVDEHSLRPYEGNLKGTAGIIKGTMEEGDRRYNVVSLEKIFP
jgi:chemotaxis signal transduction protein